MYPMLKDEGAANMLQLTIDRSTSTSPILAGERRMSTAQILLPALVAVCTWVASPVAWSQTPAAPVRS